MMIEVATGEGYKMMTTSVPAPGLEAVKRVFEKAKSNRMEPASDENGATTNSEVAVQTAESSTDQVSKDKDEAGKEIWELKLVSSSR